ncbi:MULTISPECIES: LutC/YkgG family protein [Exiguobacterium]|uniref:LutC/YkgG family protein n=1 Tax=Exiguobacterium TaxID=33986 RepID=UPI001BE608D6|nr:MULTISPECIES: lactate utilization protein C [Exiguobacterium]MCT4776234.1 lactate utilization protein C [Exiguobacterium aquaticum]MCT4788521.1 lactate utilization protein C [Exiguobacterium mexicanum]
MNPGTITNREDFLKRIAGQLGRDVDLTPPKRAYKHRPQDEVLKDASDEELLETFRMVATRIHTDVVECESANLDDTLRLLIDRYEGEAIIAEHDDRIQAWAPNTSASFDWWDAERPEDSRALAIKADIGITIADQALAESATIVQYAAPGKSRTVSLLPRDHIAIIPKSVLVPRMTQAAKRLSALDRDGDLASPNGVNFISGPSNSADIEMNLIVGVHGPIRVAYVLVHDL